MQTCWQERSRGWVVAVVVCLHVVEGGGQADHPGGQFLREESRRRRRHLRQPTRTAYAAGVNAVIGAARGRGYVGATLRARVLRI